MHLVLFINQINHEKLPLGKRLLITAVAFLVRKRKVAQSMIPKIVHYVWLGHGEKSDKIKACMESWRKFLPDYEIKEWNEDNFDINYNDFTRDSYEKKMYAFTSDVVRLYALYAEGGIYLDTDVLLYKPLDEFLTDEGFTGFEDTNYPVTAVMRC